MLIAYYSLTGNTRRFVARLAPPADRLEISAHKRATEPFVLVTPTYNFGNVPATVERFIDNNASYMVGVVGAGNRNWGDNFAKAGRIIAQQYDVPLLGVIELVGTEQDVKTITERMRELE